jgi:hypothetical protein
MAVYSVADPKGRILARLPDVGHYVQWLGGKGNGKRFRWHGPRPVLMQDVERLLGFAQVNHWQAGCTDPYHILLIGEDDDGDAHARLALTECSHCEVCMDVRRRRYTARTVREHELGNGSWFFTGTMNWPAIELWLADHPDEAKLIRDPDNTGEASGELPGKPLTDREKHRFMARQQTLCCKRLGKHLNTHGKRKFRRLVVTENHKSGDPHTHAFITQRPGERIWQQEIDLCWFVFPPGWKHPRRGPNQGYGDWLKRCLDVANMAASLRSERDPEGNPRLTRSQRNDLPLKIGFTTTKRVPPGQPGIVFASYAAKYCVKDTVARPRTSLGWGWGGLHGPRGKLADMASRKIWWSMWDTFRGIGGTAAQTAGDTAVDTAGCHPSYRVRVIHSGTDPPVPPVDTNATTWNGLINSLTTSVTATTAKGDADG